MKALVLAGGFPQIELIQKLRLRGIYTLLADYYENPVARAYADEFYQISTLDVDAIRALAKEKAVDFLITVCTDQALLSVAQVSEELGLPCYIDFQTARNVTNKAYMKKVFDAHHIPTAKFVIADSLEHIHISEWNFPLIVKPVDCNSSKGVRRVENESELTRAFQTAVEMSRTDTAIVEEFITGKELSVDVYVESGKAYILDITTSEKLKMKDRFVISRTWHPAKISQEIEVRIEQIIQQIAEAFGITDAPMLVQMLTSGTEVYVIEFSARTGGGVKHLSIAKRSGVDIIGAVIDLTLGKKPALSMHQSAAKFLVDEYIYCAPGFYDHIEGFKALKETGVITDYYVFKWRGALFDSLANSGDRIGGFSIEGNSAEELREKHNIVNRTVRVISTEGKDMMRHDLLADLNFEEA